MTKARKIKRAFTLFGGLFLAICCFVGAYLSFKNSSVDLTTVENFKGTISEKGIISYRTSTSAPTGIRLSNKAFYIKMKGLDQKLAVYNPSQSYDFLIKNVSVGDTITVYYNHSNLKEKLNLQIFQIEKNKITLLDSQDFKGSERIAFFISLIGGIVLLLLTYNYYKKTRNILRK